MTPIGPLDVLWRVCERRGWRLGLRTREMPIGFAAKLETRLATLDVRDRTEGDLLARADLLTPPAPRVDEAARLVLEGLKGRGLL